MKQSRPEGKINRKIAKIKAKEARKKRKTKGNTFFGLLGKLIKW